MGTLASGSIDLKSLKVAGEPNKYITKINENGITVHAANNVNLNYVQIDATGMEIFKNDTLPTVSIARFGDYIRLGRKDKEYVQITDKNFSFIKNDVTYFNVKQLEVTADITAKVDLNYALEYNEDALDELYDEGLYNRDTNEVQCNILVNSERYQSLPLNTAFLLKGTYYLYDEILARGDFSISLTKGTISVQSVYVDNTVSSANHLFDIEYNSGGELYLKVDNNLWREGIITIDAFTYTTQAGLPSITIGPAEGGTSYIELDYHSFKMIDKNRNIYTYFSDLRDAYNIFSYTYIFPDDGSGTATASNIITIPFNIINNSNLIVKNSNNQILAIESVSNDISSHICTIVLSNDFFEPNQEVHITAESTDQFLKAYTLGTRDSFYNIGFMSLSVGKNSSASGFASLSMGEDVSAETDYSIALGRETSTRGVGAIACGWGAYTNGTASAAFGLNTSIYGAASLVCGDSTEAGTRSFAVGQNTRAVGYNTAAFGGNTEAGSWNSFAAGKGTKAYGANQFVIGANNIASPSTYSTLMKESKYVFIIGNGGKHSDENGDLYVNNSASSNAFTVDWKGNTNISGYLTTINGTQRTGVSYIAGARGDGALLYQPHTINVDSWTPAIVIQTKSNDSWQIGNYANDNLEFRYATKANIDSQTNTTTGWSISPTGYFSGSCASATTATKATKIQDSTDSTKEITITYAKAGQTSTSWLASWNSYELGAIQPSKLWVGQATYLGASDYLKMYINSTNELNFIGTNNTSTGIYIGYRNNAPYISNYYFCNSTGTTSGRGNIYCGALNCGALSCTSLSASSNATFNAITVQKANINMQNNCALRTTLNGTTVSASSTVYSMIGLSTSDNLLIGNNAFAGVYLYAVRKNTTTAAANMLIAASPEHKLYLSTASSRRYKKDIVSLQSQELQAQKLYDLPVRQFKYKESYLSSEDKRFNMDVPGFIAEEVYEYYPIAAELKENNEPEDWNVRYIVPPMLALVQEQHKDIEQLKEEIQELKSEIQELKQLIK